MSDAQIARGIHALADLIEPVGHYWAEQLRTYTAENVRSKSNLMDLPEFLSDITEVIDARMLEFRKAGARIAAHRILSIIRFIIVELDVAVRTGFDVWAREAIDDIELLRSWFDNAELPEMLGEIKVH